MLGTDYRHSCLRVQKGEGWALLFALKFMISLGLINVIFEVDCKGVVHKIKGSTMYKTQPGHLIYHCKSLLACNPHMILDLLRDKLMVLS